MIQPPVAIERILGELLYRHVDDKELVTAVFIAKTNLN
jgi:hypothetical protein